MLPMQTLETMRPAVAVTRQEFSGFLARAWDAAIQLISDPEKGRLWRDTLGPVPRSDEERCRFELEPTPVGGWLPPQPPGIPPGWPPILSFDNPSIHDKLGLPAHQRFPLPVRSSDIHKTVEHTHARLGAAFERWYYADPQVYPVAAYKGVLEQIFKTDPGVASAATIMKDVCTIPGLAAMIIARGGGEVPKEFR